MRTEQPVLTQPCDPHKLERDGYLVLKMHPRVRAAIDAVFSQGLAFFRQSSELRLREVNTNPYDGHKEIGYSFSADPQRPDLAQAFFVKPAASTGNKEPGEGHALRSRMYACADLLDEIATALAISLEQHFHAGHALPASLTFGRGSHLQLSYYHPETSTRELLQDAHEDGAFATLTTATAGGLEILTGGAFSLAPVLSRHDVLCMPGEIMALLSGGRTRPLYHRVRRLPEPHERLSLMYFASPDPQPGRVLQPWIANDTNAGIDIMARVISNPTRFGLPSLA